ncbi:uncharacterized protein L3040_002751 [Drepanopeziza brunnea f. sp. 'multigermtubi']|uniref:uncharacterized protein n=1 Tax=Drepanopeziza brunnea f. sp. 'multigermtubi' TaxID=698441 RepID=UPI0023893350|nr:hypothetical protein L3040_002751 [Drepanopeziza brunnea f. sp. 'multigermtubi']
MKNGALGEWHWESNHRHTVCTALALIHITNPSSLAETLIIVPNSTSLKPHHTAAFDIGSATEVAKFIADVISKYRQTDHLFNCADINPRRLATEEITDASWDKLMKHKPQGAIRRHPALHPPSSAQLNNSQHFFYIVALETSAQDAFYHATTAGIIGFSKTTALELGLRGIRINFICPG